MNFSDEELMVMFSAGTTEAFDILYDRYKHRIYGFVLGCLQSPADSEEVVQDVFLRVARSGHTYQPTKPFKSWIFTIASNRIKSTAILRKTQQQKQRELKLLQFETGTSVSLEGNPERPVIVREELHNLFSHLDSDQRMMLILKEVEGWSTNSIAESMGMTPENVRIRVHRARKKLRAVSDFNDEGDHNELQ